MWRQPGEIGGGDANIAGVWSFTGEAESSGGITATCTTSGVLSLNQSGSTASGAYDGPVTCILPIIGDVDEDVDDPVTGIQVDGNDVSWTKENCVLDGEVEDEDRIEGTMHCETEFNDLPVTVEGTWQMSQ